MDILVFGDSITQGFDDTEKGGWVNRLFLNVGARPNRLGDKYHLVFNLGISGDITRGLLERFESELKQRSDSDALIIIDIGGNDSVRDLRDKTNEVEFETFSENYQSLISTGKKYGQVVCLGLHDSDESKLNPMRWYEGHAALDEDSAKYDAEIKKLAKQNQVLYIDMKGLLSKNFDGLTYDGDHPNPEGHRLIFERVKEALEKENII